MKDPLQMRQRWRMSQGNQKIAKDIRNKNGERKNLKVTEIILIILKNDVL